MQLIKHSPLFLAMALVASPTTWADTKQVSSESTDIETISVYGEFNPIETNKMQSPTYILDREDIAPIVGNTALDVLAQVPGINIRKSGNVKEVFLRGAESNFLIIQIDGVQVNNPLDDRGGTFDLSSLGKDAIARVEVIKGAQSSIYGSDALAGVINFITFDKEAEGAKVSVGYLEDGQKSGTIKAGYAGWAVSLSGIDTDEQAAGDSQQLAEIAAEGNLALTQNSETTINLRFSDYSNSAFPGFSGGPEYATDPTKETKEGETLTASLRHQIKVNEHYQMAMQLEHLSSEDTLNSPGIAPYFMAPPAFTENDYRHNKFRWLNAVEVDNVSATIGVDYKTEEGETSGYLFMFGQNIPTNYQLSRNNLAGFIDAKFDLSDTTIYLGGRVDKPEDRANETTWKLGINHPISANVRIFANIGNAFKLPSLYALGNNLVGNPELKAETANNADIGIEWSNETTDISLSVFDYDYKNLIDFDSEAFMVANIESVTTQGAELILSSDISSEGKMTANVTYADIETGEGESLAGRPKWQGGASINWQWADEFSTYLSANYVGESFARSLHTGDFTHEVLSAYTKFDASANWVVSESIDVDFYLTNVLDKKYYYAYGFTGHERGLGLKFNWQFL